jgi:hypothetical protein
MKSNPNKRTLKTWQMSVFGLLMSTLAVQADGTLSTAIAIEPGEIPGEISPVDDEDYYKFIIDSPQMITIASKAVAVGTVPTTVLLRLYDAGGKLARIIWIQPIA